MIGIEVIISILAMMRMVMNDGKNQCDADKIMLSVKMLMNMMMSLMIIVMIMMSVLMSMNT